MKYRIILIVVAIFVSNSAISQVFPLLPKYYQPLDSAVLAENESEEEKNETLIKKHEKLSYSVAVGSGFSSFGNDVTMMSSYIAPSLHIEISPKLHLAVDGFIMQSNINGLDGAYANDSRYSLYSSPHNYGITGMAYYQLTDKWSVYGDGSYFDNQSGIYDYRFAAYDKEYKSVSVGVGYKVSDKVNFNIQYRYSNGLDPTYSSFSPFHRSGFGYYDSPFGMVGY
jgi:outer membrane protein assembly factor BamA